MDAQAISLNTIIGNENSNILKMLSERGKNIYFPKLGILAQSAQAKGKGINATIGEAFDEDGTSLHLPEFDSLVNMPVTNIFPYAPSYGKPELRNYWKESVYKKNPSLGNVLISNPIATNGLTHGLSVAGYLFTDPDDTVLLSDHYWENYNLIFENAYGAKISTFELFKDGRFNVEDFGNKLSKANSDKIILLLNFPNNPAGYTPLITETDGIVRAIKKAADSGKKIVVLIDDAYFGLVYESDVFPESIFVKLASLSENVLAVKLDGPTKEDYVWGFRVGFITFGFKGANTTQLKALENKAAGAVRGTISNVSCLSQAILLKGYTAPEYAAQKKQKYEVLANRVRRIHTTLKEHPEYAESFEVMPFNSGYFMCVKPIGVDNEELRKELIANYDTGVIVLSGLIRLAFSSVPIQYIDTLFANLHSAIRKLRK